MNIYMHTLTSILVLAAIISLIVLLRNRGMLKQENGVLFSKLVTQVTLPAIIFYALSHSVLEWKYLLLFLIMIASAIVMLAIAWLIGKSIKLPHPQMGTFLLVSGFGSSSLLGYALVAELFPTNADALAEAAFISELGVGLPLFTVGVMIAMFYGNSEEKSSHLLNGALLFFRSPIFISIAAGTVWSLLKLPIEGALMGPLFDAIHIIGKANTFMVTLTVGVLLQFSALRSIIVIALAVILIKLILNPLLVYIPASTMHLEEWQLQVLILEAAMPSAMLSVVLANRYGCDAKLASKLVFITLIVSVFTATAMLNLLG